MLQRMPHDARRLFRALRAAKCQFSKSFRRRVDSLSRAFCRSLHHRLAPKSADEYIPPQRLNYAREQSCLLDAPRRRHAYDAYFTAAARDDAIDLLPAWGDADMPMMRRAATTADGTPVRAGAPALLR